MTEEIKVTISGTDATGPATTSAKENIEAVGTAAKTVGEASASGFDRLTFSLSDIQQKLAATKSNFDTLFPVIVEGGAAGKQALAVLTASVDGLALALKNVQPGLLIPPAALASLTAMQASLGGVTAAATGEAAAMGEAAAATLSAAEADRILAAAGIDAAAATRAAAADTEALSVEASFARDSVGGMARGLATMGGDISTLMLTMIAVPLVLDMIGRGLEKVGTASDSLGEKLYDSVTGFNQQQLAEQKAGESATAYSDRLNKVADAMAMRTRAAVLMASGLINQEADDKRASAAVEGYGFSLHGVIEQFPKFEAAAKAMGLSFRATQEEMAAATQTFLQAYKGELLSGEGNAKAWADSNKAALDKIVSYYVEAGQKVPDSLKKIAESIGLVSKAEKEAASNKVLHDKLIEDANVTKVLEAEIQRLTTAFGSEKAAVAAMAPVMTKMIDDLTKLKTTNAADEATRKESLASLEALAAKYGLVEGAMKKVTDAADKAIASWKEQQIRLKELNQEYEAHVKAVTLAADRSAAAVKREGDEVRTALNQQILDLEKNHQEGLVENSDYNEKMSALAAALNLAIDAAAVEGDRIREKERLDLDKLAEKHRETAGKIEESQSRIAAAAAAAAAGIQHSSEIIVAGIDALPAKVQKVEDSFVDMATKAAEAGQKVKAPWDETIPVLRDVAIQADSVRENLERAAAGGDAAAAMLLDLYNAGAPIGGLLSDIGMKALATFGDSGGASTPVESAPTTGTAAPGTEF